MTNKSKPICVIFLLLEAVLYYFILTTNNKWFMFGSIALCLVYALIHFCIADKFACGALAFTLIADYFLVLCAEQNRIWGMVFFLGTQTMYAVMLQHRRFNLKFLIARISLIIIAEIITITVLGNSTDLLAVISLCYYANLIMSIIEGFSQLSINKLFPIGMVLFLLCDTAIGLQIACGGYLPVASDSPLFAILYPGFNLAWSFYLPSQVLLALSVTKNIRRNRNEGVAEKSGS